MQGESILAFGKLVLREFVRVLSLYTFIECKRTQRLIVVTCFHGLFPNLLQQAVKLQHECRT